MALPQGFVLDQEEKPTKGLPAGFELDTAPTAAQTAPQPSSNTGFFTNLGRSAASLADVTVGSVIPTVAQMFAYPLARLNRSPEEAQATTQRLVSSLDKPFGKALGVTETPQYQQEAGRQIVDFIGKNAQKGAEWIASKTGIPAADVESYLSTLSLTAPIVAKPVAKTVSAVVKPIQEQISAGLQLPFEKQIQARKEAASLKDYERGPQIEAAAEAQRLGLVIPPENIQPTMGPKMWSSVAGEAGLQKLAKTNESTIRSVVLNELDLPADRQLNGKAAFNEARAKISQPYNEIRSLPTMSANANILSSLEALRPDASLIATDVSAKRINALVDRAVNKVSQGIDGTEILRDIKKLREEASTIYGNKASKLEARDRADASIGIANTLEAMIESNIANPQLLQQFKEARTKMAKSYAYEKATDFNTGKVDVSKLSRMTAKDNALTGDIASLAKVAGNFPEAFSPSLTTGWINPQLKRTGVAGTAGALAGYALGDGFGGALGAALGATAGEVAQSIAARRLASPSYQAGLSLKDMRIKAPQAAPVTQAPPSTELVPYQSPVEVLMPGEGTYFPNFVRQAQPIYSTSFGQRALPNEVPRQIYEAQQNAELAQRYRSNDPSQSLFYGQRRAYQAPEPVVGQALPVEQSITTAAQKVASGQLFNMTAAEKVAWNKTKVDIQEISPSLKALDSKAIAEKMADRVWVQETINKAKEKIKGYAEIEARAATRDTQRKAAVERAKMEDVVQQLQDTLQARPSSRGYEQGPKTQAFQRGLLSGN